MVGRYNFPNWAQFWPIFTGAVWGKPVSGCFLLQGGGIEFVRLPGKKPRVLKVESLQALRVDQSTIFGLVLEISLL